MADVLPTLFYLFLLFLVFFGWASSGVILRIVIGVFVGFGSALTGSSGPVLLLPILIALRWDIFVSLGCAQTVQIPIAVASVLAYVVARPGVIDFEIGAVLSATLAPIIVVGTPSCLCLRARVSVSVRV